LVIHCQYIGERKKLHMSSNEAETLSNRIQNAGRKRRGTPQRGSIWEPTAVGKQRGRVCNPIMHQPQGAEVVVEGVPWGFTPGESKLSGLQLVCSQTVFRVNVCNEVRIPPSISTQYRHPQSSV